ncbi:MAG: dihydroneopterin aldolase [Clostridia bacterium]|nr:dihydroneopterin aldolase [Clostridia bacterium]
MDKIIVKGLNIFAYHGVNPEEKINGQEFIVDAILGCNLEKPCASDDLNDTINYAKVVKVIRAAMTDETFDLIERAAGEIANRILAEFEKVESVKVTLKKPHAPVSAQFDYMAVSIIRGRE